jgi:hypothetical protein
MAQSPAATKLSMLDGCAAIAAGPVLFDHPQWIPQSTRMHSTTAAPRSSRRSLPSWCATTTSVTSARGRPIGSSPSTGGKPTATSTRGPGADSMPPCIGGCQLGIVAQHRRHQQRPPPAHLRALGRRSRKSLVRDRKRPKGKAFPRKAYTDIPAVVEAMCQYWMPIRFR